MNSVLILRLRQRHPWRLFKNGGAVLTLLWLFSCSLLLGYNILYKYFARNDQYLNNVLFFLALIFIFPVAGWLADVCCGRYRILKYSLWIIWSAGILILLVNILDNVTSWEYWVNVEMLFFVLMLIGLGGFLANVIQFGVDQLVDASSTELESYISWGAWVFHLGIAVQFLSQFCFCKEYLLVSKILGPLFVTVSLCLDIFCKRRMVKEPACHNPFKLIFKVLWYAIKNKYPRQRSAFTYWEDKRYSRIDLAKSKFGGPFTTEQVEDVKTFFRMLILVSIVFFSVSFCRLGTITLFGQYSGNFFDKECSNAFDYATYCLKHILVKYFDYLEMVIVIPMHELLFYPLLNSICPRLKEAITITRKFVFGLFLLLLCNVSLLFIEVLAHENETMCFLFANSTTSYLDSTLSISLWWLVLPKAFAGLSFYVLLTGFLEFVCAQCPYSMKGLLLGAMYGIFSLSILFSSLTEYIIRGVFKKLDVAKSCGMWYFSLSVIANLLVLFLTGGAVWWYSKRRRDENIHNEHMFAVNYYDRYIEANTQSSLSDTDED